MAERKKLKYEPDSLMTTEEVEMEIHIATKNPGGTSALIVDNDRIGTAFFRRNLIFELLDPWHHHRTVIFHAGDEKPSEEDPTAGWRYKLDIDEHPRKNPSKLTKFPQGDEQDLVSQPVGDRNWVRATLGNQLDGLLKPGLGSSTMEVTVNPYGQTAGAPMITLKRRANKSKTELVGKVPDHVDLFDVFMLVVHLCVWDQYENEKGVFRTIVEKRSEKGKEGKS